MRRLGLRRGRVFAAVLTALALWLAAPGCGPPPASDAGVDAGPRDGGRHDADGAEIGACLRRCDECTTELGYPSCALRCGEGGWRRACVLELTDCVLLHGCYAEP